MSYEKCFEPISRLELLYFYNMDIQSTKIELAKLILSIDNPSLIAKIKELLTTESSDFWHTLSETEKQEIIFGIDQLDKGQRISFEEFLSKVS
jgi:hypothetical protein